MPSNTQIKIRYGMILQAVLSKALKDAGFSFAETPAYDPDSEVPDFLIPDAVSPRFMVEVHQTEARNHFQMKTLRSVTAVAEAKAFFGPAVISVNILFGDPERELPGANLRAMCGIFDVNLLLRREASEAGKRDIAALETAALQHAGNVKLPTAEAGRKLCASHPQAVAEFKRLLKMTLEDGSVNESLAPMWKAERKRRALLGTPPEPGKPTFYKKNMVRSLFFRDEQFEAMAADPNPESWDSSIAKQVVATGIGNMAEEIDGDHLTLDAEFSAFLRDPDAPRLRALCKQVLDAIPAMRWFFEDIRSQDRRKRMANAVITASGKDQLRRMLLAAIRAETVAGVYHSRCWPADVLACVLGVSHNRMNRWCVDNGCDPTGMGNPFNQLCYRSERFLSLGDKCSQIATGVSEVLERMEDAATVSWDPDVVSERLMALRLVGSMRLRRLDALPLLAEVTAKRLGLSFAPLRMATILGDLACERSAGTYEFYAVDHAALSVIVHAIAAEGNPRDKAKEWGARKLASMYRLKENSFPSGEGQTSIFIIDGIWAQSDVTRLYRCGWTHVVRMTQLEGTLRAVFGIRDGAVSTAQGKTLQFPTDLSDLPMAAEED